MGEWDFRTEILTILQRLCKVRHMVKLIKRYFYWRGTVQIKEFRDFLALIDYCGCSSWAGGHKSRCRPEVWNLIRVNLSLPQTWPCAALFLEALCLLCKAHCGSATVRLNNSLDILNQQPGSRLSLQGLAVRERRKALRCLNSQRTACELLLDYCGT